MRKLAYTLTAGFYLLTACAHTPKYPINEELAKYSPDLRRSITLLADMDNNGEIEGKDELKRLETILERMEITKRPETLKRLKQAEKDTSRQDSSKSVRF
jgi:5S rRNA maturation endonuclease (ribonuclease M5)